MNLKRAVNIKRRATPFLIALVVLIGVTALAFVAFRAYKAAGLKRATAIESQRGIDVVETVSLGGVEFGLMIRGEDRANPLLLFIHGGPGAPARLLHRYYEQDLLKHFTVVHYDQRGIGKSAGTPLDEEALTIDHFVQDALNIAAYLQRRFDKRRLYLLGHCLLYTSDAADE